MNVWLELLFQFLSLSRGVVGCSDSIFTISKWFVRVSSCLKKLSHMRNLIFRKFSHDPSLLHFFDCVHRSFHIFLRWVLRSFRNTSRFALIAREKLIERLFDLVMWLNNIHDPVIWLLNYRFLLLMLGYNLLLRFRSRNILWLSEIWKALAFSGPLFIVHLPFQGIFILLNLTVLHLQQLLLVLPKVLWDRELLFDRLKLLFQLEIILLVLLMLFNFRS